MQLVVQSTGTSIRRHEGCFELRNGDRKRRIAPNRIESIVLGDRCFLSTSALLLALDHNIDVLVMDHFGDPVGRFWRAKLGNTARIRRRQLEAGRTEVGRRIVQELLTQKLKNQRKFIKRLQEARRKRHAEFIPALESLDKAIMGIAAIQELLPGSREAFMAVEGGAARHYYEQISRILPTAYRFPRRSRRPAEDPFNAALNYAFGMLYSTVERACLLAGLDPQTGLLHADSYNRPGMVLDLIEPFRICVERPVVYLFTGRRFSDDDFQRTETATTLSDSGKKKIVETVLKSLDERVRFRKRNLSRKMVIQQEAHRLGNWLLSEQATCPDPTWLEIEEL